VLKHKLHRALCAQLAVAFGKVAAHIGYRPVVVVCGGFYQHGNAVWGIAFKQGLFVIALVFVSRAFDGTSHIVLGHVGGFGILNNST